MPRTHYRPDKIDETYGDIGWSPEETTEVSAVLLNCLQDWHLFHRRVFSSRPHLPDAPGLSGPVAPTLSSIDRGPLGICQLPRTWLKTCLRVREAGCISTTPTAPRAASTSAACADLAGGSGRSPCVLSARRCRTYLAFEDWVRQEGHYREKKRWRPSTSACSNASTSLPSMAEIHATLQRPPTWTSGGAAQSLGRLALTPTKGWSEGKLLQRQHPRVDKVQHIIY